MKEKVVEEVLLGLEFISKHIDRIEEEEFPLLSFRYNKREVSCVVVELKDYLSKTGKVLSLKQGEIISLNRMIRDTCNNLGLLLDLVESENFPDEEDLCIFKNEECIIMTIINDLKESLEV